MVPFVFASLHALEDDTIKNYHEQTDDEPAPETTEVEGEPTTLN